MKSISSILGVSDLQYELSGSRRRLKGSGENEMRTTTSAASFIDDRRRHQKMLNFNEKCSIRFLSMRNVNWKSQENVTIQHLAGQNERRRKREKLFFPSLSTFTLIWTKTSRKVGKNKTKSSSSSVHKFSLALEKRVEEEKHWKVCVKVHKSSTYWIHG